MILLLAQAFPPRIGGVEALMAGFANALVQAGHEVIVLADAAKTGAAHDGAQAYQVQRFGGLKPLRRRLKAAHADRLIAERAPQAVIADTWKSIEFLRRPAPLAVLAHGSELLSAPDSAKGQRISRAFAKARVVIANSHYTAKLAAGHTRTPVRVIPPGVELIQPPSEAAQQRLQALVHDARCIVTLARLEPRKGVDATLRALSMLGADFADVNYIVAGGGDDRPRLEALAAELGLSSRVHFLGPVFEDDKAAALARASVFLLPARREGASVEGFGLVYREAAQFGAPSIAGAEGGGADAVADGETGLVVQGDDPGQIAKALSSLLSDEALRSRLGEAARARVMDEGLWPHVHKLYLDALKSV